jgi:hypothetical protein
MNSIAPTSTPRRLCGEQHLEVARHLASRRDLLLVPRGARRRGSPGRMS